MNGLEADCSSEAYHVCLPALTRMRHDYRGGYDPALITGRRALGRKVQGTSVDTLIAPQTSSCKFDGGITWPLVSANYATWTSGSVGKIESRPVPESRSLVSS